ncbi:DNA-directed RNA polymerase subunit delta [Lactobacillus sp. PV037]|uniref:DNA-directed RNA polymerase subunit delta n=1 Tax=unclassified Lactobacillus TaxID=2620435 RepID=UPI00223E9CD8|nr:MULTISPECIES: DNA-directed RNA polymerase subunit delta [unclassified Lactobacillus]QNQ81782.1 DNA-directed RNA polymerase subunit delta [Lactobacillus sp. PV012]QNQ84459.1 DNA-directed RNA polymerase subunit delta [Lactobacillus sp. PV037]
MGLSEFEDQNKDELSMIEVARAILQDNGKRMAFADIVNAIQKFLGKSDEEIRERLPQFYTDLNTDGEFISLGDNIWALRSWYPYESVDEEVNHPEDEEDVPRKKRHKKVNAFIGDSDDDDIIDYDSDDPEDEDLEIEDDDEDEYSDDDLDDATDNELDDGIEGQLSELHPDDDDEDE